MASKTLAILTLALLLMGPASAEVLEQAIEQDDAIPGCEIVAVVIGPPYLFYDVDCAIEHALWVIGIVQT